MCDLKTINCAIRKKLTRSKTTKFGIFLVELLIIESIIKMEPISLTAVVAISLGCTAVGFLTRYFYDKSTEEPKIEKEENKMGNVIVTNIKEAVEVEDHDHVVIGLYIIVGLLILMIAIYLVQKYVTSIKKRTLRRALASSNELEAV